MGRDSRRKWQKRAMRYLALRAKSRFLADTFRHLFDRKKDQFDRTLPLIERALIERKLAPKKVAKPLIRKFAR